MLNKRRNGKVITQYWVANNVDKDGVFNQYKNVLRERQRGSILILIVVGVSLISIVISTNLFTTHIKKVSKTDKQSIESSSLGSKTLAEGLGKGIIDVFEEACGSLTDEWTNLGDPPIRKTITKKEIDYYKLLGLNYVIISYNWDNVAPHYSGISDTSNEPIRQNLSLWNDPNYNFSSLDRMVKLVVDGGMDVGIIVGNPPRWAVENAPEYEPNIYCIDLTPGLNTKLKKYRRVIDGERDSNTYNEYYMALAERYNGTHNLPKVKYFLVANEQNYANRGPQDEGGITQRVADLNVTYLGIKQRNPNSEVWMANLSSHGTCNSRECTPGENRTPESWLRIAYDKGLLLDRLGYHPYLIDYTANPNNQPVYEGRFIPNNSIQDLLNIWSDFPRWSNNKPVMSEAGMVDTRGVLSEDTISTYFQSILTKLDDIQIDNWTNFLLDMVPQADSGLIIRPRIKSQSIFPYNGGFYETQSYLDHLWIRRVFSFNPLDVGPWSHYNFSELSYPGPALSYPEIAVNKHYGMATQFFIDNGDNKIRESTTLGNRYWVRTLQLNYNLSTKETTLSPDGPWTTNNLKSAWRRAIHPYHTNLDSQTIGYIPVLEGGSTSDKYLEFITQGEEYWYRTSNNINTGWSDFINGRLSSYFDNTTSNNSDYPHPPVEGIDSHYIVYDGSQVREGITAQERYWVRTGTSFNNMGNTWYTNTIENIQPGTTFDNNGNPTDLTRPINRAWMRPIFNTYKNYNFSFPIQSPTPNPTASMLPTPKSKSVPTPTPTPTPTRRILPTPRSTTKPTSPPSITTPLPTTAPTFSATSKPVLE